MGTLAPVLDGKADQLAHSIRASRYGRLISVELMTSATSEGSSYFVYRVKTSTGHILTVEYQYTNGTVAETWTNEQGEPLRAEEQPDTVSGPDGDYPWAGLPEPTE